MSDLEPVTLISVWWGGRYQGSMQVDQYEGYLEELHREHPEVTDVHFEARVGWRHRASGRGESGHANER